MGFFLICLLIFGATIGCFLYALPNNVVVLHSKRVFTIPANSLEGMLKLDSTIAVILFFTILVVGFALLAFSKNRVAKLIGLLLNFLATIFIFYSLIPTINYINETVKMMLVEESLTFSTIYITTLVLTGVSFFFNIALYFVTNHKYKKPNFFNSINCKE